MKLNINKILATCLLKDTKRSLIFSIYILYINMSCVKPGYRYQIILKLLQNLKRFWNRLTKAVSLTCRSQIYWWIESYKSFLIPFNKKKFKRQAESSYLQFKTLNWKETLILFVEWIHFASLPIEKTRIKRKFTVAALSNQSGMKSFQSM